jgi:DNA-binding transcriptional LysR family regulator
MDRAVTQVSAWPGVEFRHFLALEAVASEASFHRAAEKLGYTQSAISQQIAALERAVGHKLVERPRGAQPVRLTRAGEIVVQHARAIGARLANAQADLLAQLEGSLDPLRVGFFGRGLGALMPGIFRRLEHDGSADFQLRVTEARRDDDLVAMIQCGEVDVAFVNLPVDADECTYVALLEDEYVLVVDARTPREAPTLEELAALPLIAFKTPGRACQLTSYFELQNLEPNWIVASDDVESIYAFVASGFGVALLPRLATVSLGPKVKLVELDCGLPPRRIGIAWSAVRSQSAAARDFVDAALVEAGRFERGQLLLAS